MAVIESSRTKPRAAGANLSPLASLASAEPDISIEDEAEELDEPEQHPDRSAAEIKKNLLDWIENPNIARDIPQAELSKLGQLVVDEYNIDENSRAEWKAEAESALKFAVQDAEPKIYPWENASNVIFPLITSAAMEFAALAYPAIIQGREVVKGVVWGDDDGTPVTQNGKADGAPKLTDTGQPIWLVAPGSKTKRAAIIGEHMSWQVLEQMEEWEPQTDQMLHQLPIVGGAVRKTFRDPSEDCNSSVLVDLMKLVWSMHAPSFQKAPRKTEIQEFYPYQIEEFERDDEKFIPLVYGAGDQAPGTTDADATPSDPNDTEAPHVFIEQHRRYDLDGDGYAEPLTVTVHLRSCQVVRIVARYEEEGICFNEKTGDLKRITPIEAYTLYPFLPNMKGGSYPMGFGHLLKPLNEAVNTTINQMFDAGHLQIAGGGFIGSGLSIHAGSTQFSLGEFKPVNNKGGALRDNIFTMPWPGPNSVLFQLLGFLVEAGKQVASIKDALTGDTALANTAPTTMLALVKQGMRVYTAIYKRIYRALKSEFSKIYRLNRIYLEEDERYRIGDTWRTVTPDDYRLGGGVEPYADPTMVTDTERLTRAALVRQEAETNPLVDKLEATRRVFQAAQVDNINKLIPDKAPPAPPTPEQMAAQQAQAELQVRAASAQSKMGQERALELMQYTQAMLNLQKAKSEATGPQMAWMENQLDLMRLHIESLNTTVKAAAVDAKMHHDNLHHIASMTGHAVHHAGNMADAAERARQIANEQPDETGPPDDGGDGASTVPQPGGDGDGGSGLPAMATPSGDASLPALPGAPVPGADPGGG